MLCYDCTVSIDFFCHHPWWQRSEVDFRSFICMTNYIGLNGASEQIGFISSVRGYILEETYSRAHSHSRVQ